MDLHLDDTENNVSSATSSSTSSSTAPTLFNINTNASEENAMNALMPTTTTATNMQQIHLKSSQSDSILTHENNIKSGTNNGLRSGWLLRCPLCMRSKNNFFCCDCIKNGDFTYSKGRFPERFAEKKLKLFKLKEEQTFISERIDSILQHNVLKDELAFKVRKVEANIKVLNEMISDAKQKLSMSQMNVHKIKNNQIECKERHAKHIDKINGVQQYLNHRKTSINKRSEIKGKLLLDIKELLEARVEELHKYIFPIQMTSSDAKDDNESNKSSLETTPLLTFSGSSHLNTGNYSIVEPWLPANGDYSDYNLSADSRREFPNRESNCRNPEFRIGAALSYLTQFMNVLAFYLDIRLPRRLSYSEFCLNELNDELLTHKVAKLNANVIYLCLSQNVHSDLLQPRQTIKNLLNLLDPEASLGSPRPILIGADFLELINDSLLEDLNLIDEPDVPDSDLREHDDELTDFDWVEQNLPDLHWTTSGQQTSLAGGFMSTAAASVASFWKAATGQK